MGSGVIAENRSWHRSSCLDFWSTFVVDEITVMDWFSTGSRIWYGTN